MTQTTIILITNIKWYEGEGDTTGLPKTFEVELNEGGDIQEQACEVLMEKFDVRPWSFDWERATQEVRRGGKQDFSNWHKGVAVTEITQLSVGLHLFNENKQFGVTNLCEVTKVDLTRGIAHAKFIDPQNPSLLRSGANADGFAIWDYELQTTINSYTLATLAPANKPDGGLTMDYTVTIQVSVTADSPEQAAQLAINDLRDESLGPWNADVTCSRGKTTVQSAGSPVMAEVQHG